MLFSRYKLQGRRNWVGREVLDPPPILTGFYANFLLQKGGGAFHPPSTRFSYLPKSLKTNTLSCKSTKEKDTEKKNDKKSHRNASNFIIFEDAKQCAYLVGECKLCS